jgi:O-antigen ligase
MIGEYPWTGVGIGSFIIGLSRRAGEGYVVEPAHSIPLLAGAELGIPGLAVLVAISVLFFYRLHRTAKPDAILVGAALSGLGVIGLFDHYLWTLAPGRLMLGLVIGLYISQDKRHDA